MTELQSQPYPTGSNRSDTPFMQYRSPVGRRPVREDVAEMTAAAAAMHFGSGREQAAVGLTSPTASGKGAKKLGQPVPLSNFVSLVEQLLAATRRRHEHAWPLFGIERAAAGPLGAVLAEHAVLPRASARLSIAASVLAVPSLVVHDGVHCWLQR